MKNRKKIWFYAALPVAIAFTGAIILLSGSCKKERNLPRVTTTIVSNITETSATCGGEIISDGDASITEKGVCWTTGPTPTTADSKTSEGEGIGSFTSNISGLAPNTLYNVCAYATNSVGTAYGSILAIHTWSGTVTDIDGNVYPTINIFTQTWMGENLKTKKLNNGVSIELRLEPTDFGNSVLPAYSFVESNGIPPIKSTYGNLYNGIAVGTGKLCPSGWHVPSDVEWQRLVAYLGGDLVAGGKMKEEGTEHWANPNAGATNESGFTALPGGWLMGKGGASCGGEILSPMIGFFGSYCFWWSSTENFDMVSTVGLESASAQVLSSTSPLTDGHSVRCIKD